LVGDAWNGSHCWVLSLTLACSSSFTYPHASVWKIDRGNNSLLLITTCVCALNVLDRSDVIGKYIMS
jgi:hypothetical protein